MTGRPAYDLSTEHDAVIRRRKKILFLAGRGFHQRDIARMVGVDLRTVSRHLTFERLGRAPRKRGPAASS